MSDEDGTLDEAADALWSIMSECEGHRYGQQGYDITLDHIYEMAVVARDILTAQLGRPLSDDLA